MKVFFFALLIALLVVIGWAAVMGITARCFSFDAGCLFGPETWIHNYQSLVAGVLALAAAGVVYFQTTTQIEIERQKLKQAELEATRRQKELDDARRERTLLVFIDLDLALRDFMGGAHANDPAVLKYASADLRSAVRRMAQVHYAFATWLHIHVQRAELALLSVTGEETKEKRFHVAMLHVDIIATYTKKFDEELVDQVGDLRLRQISGDVFKTKALELNYEERYLAFHHYYV